jgi:hypothetical protein
MSDVHMAISCNFLQFHAIAIIKYEKRSCFSEWNSQIWFTVHAAPKKCTLYFQKTFSLSTSYRGVLVSIPDWQARDLKFDPWSELAFF